MTDQERKELVRRIEASLNNIRVELKEVYTLVKQLET